MDASAQLVPEIEVIGVSKHFGGGQQQPCKQIISDVSFCIYKGQLTTIVGPSGCGKTTLAKIVAGLLSPSKGDIILAGLSKTEPHSVSMVFQDYSKSLFPWLTVIENVELALKTTSLNRRAKRLAALTALTRVGLEEEAEAHIWELSGGMQQRVAFARALVRKPLVLVLDEPFGSVDMFTRMRLQNEVLALKKILNLSVLVVTHDIDEAVYLSDVILVMGTGGRIVASLQVPLGYPRDQVSTRSQPQFLEVRSAVFESLNLIDSVFARS